MKKSGGWFLAVPLAVAIVAVLCSSQTTKAGWTGSMNGVGFGLASVNVTSSTLRSNKVTTPTMYNPSAAMTNTATYFVGAPLPSGSSTATVARIKGSAGYVWKASTVGSNGDKTDNDGIEKRINIYPADCASLEMDSTAVIAPDEKSGTITVNSIGTAGTAIWLRGYEYISATPPGSVQDLETNANSLLKWDILLVGPFNLNNSNCTALVIPFTVETSTTNLYFVTDGIAKSNPLILYCPSNVVANCGEPIQFAPVLYAGCGDVKIEYNPPLNSTFPIGVTPVTVTATDKDGNKTNCTFTVTILDTTEPKVPALAVLSGEASVQVPTPIATDVCGTVTNTIVGTTTDPTFYNTQGTFVVRWRFDDGNGNVVVSNQTVIVDDVTAPVAPTLADATGQCSVTLTPPTALDNVVGAITGTTTSPLTYTVEGTNLVTWTFDDGNGNTSSATQRVIVNDVTPPAKPTLANLTFNTCDGLTATPPVPTTTDNCKGTVWGTTSTVFPLTNLGTTTVTWTFDDGNGNKTTADQSVTISAMSFLGFYAPIAGTKGTCESPLRTVNQGSIVPLKFDIKCGSTLVTSGQPPVVKIQAYSNNCTPGSELVSVNAVYQNDWHYNWDTSGWAKGVYRVIVVLPDGTSRFVFVRLK